MAKNYTRVSDGHVIRAESQGGFVYAVIGGKLPHIIDNKNVGAIRTVDGWTPERLREIADDMEEQQRLARQGKSNE